MQAGLVEDAPLAEGGAVSARSRASMLYSNPLFQLFPERSSRVRLAGSIEPLSSAELLGRGQGGGGAEDELGDDAVVGGVDAAGGFFLGVLRGSSDDGGDGTSDGAD